ncbi:DNA (cytosine-5)-methyltransferase 1 [Sphingobium sp. AP50]|uniref:DNA cytosine methyltransferase n=1 Tax=Sphingobium sp. AP50 TaxID=1884369 RepID=UPI0008CB492B|nr:DNA cytosine methyltransferase [Sphingobium sp. AP50]SEK03673.1 DNA (cytosine-5)-methyltransferase 1 [Sphingobium sp. AP50]
MIKNSVAGLQPTSIELFAGCGGLALGLHRAGWNGLFAVERDAMAFETLEANLVGDSAPFKAFGQWPSWMPRQNTDLVALLSDDNYRENLSKLRGTVDLVAGGPPCQGFSVGGKRDGEDERNSLVYRMLDFVELVQPRAVLIENVEGMARRFVSKPGSAGGSVAEDAIAKLEDLGYIASYHLINSADFGVPQARKRVAIIGLLSPAMSRQALHEITAIALAEAAKAVRLEHGLPADGNISVKDAIDDLSSARLVPSPDSPRFKSGIYTSAKSAYAKLMREGVPSGAIPDSHRMTIHGETVRELYELAHSTQKPGRLSKEFLLANGTKKDKKVLLDSSAVVATITTHPDEYIHYKFPRNITVREMARLQSFPDRFTFHGRYTINGPRRKFDVARCSQVGNAVPPLMGEGLGRAILKIFEQVGGARSFRKSAPVSVEA